MVFAAQDVVRIPPVFQHRDRICGLHRAVHIVGSHPRRTPGLCASSHRSTAETDSAAEEREFEPAVQPRERNRIAAPSCPVYVRGPPAYILASQRPSSCSNALSLPVSARPEWPKNERNPPPRCNPRRRYGGLFAADG